MIAAAYNSAFLEDCKFVPSSLLEQNFEQGGDFVLDTAHLSGLVAIAMLEQGLIEWKN